MGVDKGPPPISPAWEATLAAFHRELVRRGSSRHTLRAYGGDLAELAEWATAREQDPASLTYRDLRSYAAALSARGLARASVARKLAAVRTLHDHLARSGEAAENPAELLPMPKKAARLPRVLGPDEVARLLDHVPASGPLEVRDRAMLELTYACGLRAEEVIDLDADAPDFESETLRVTGKGRKTRIVPIGEPAQRALERYLSHARPALVTDSDQQALFLSRRGGDSPHPTSGAVSTGGCARRPWPAMSPHTRSATRSRPTCWRGAPTCARSRSSLGTPASRQPRSTRGWSPDGCGASTHVRIRGRDRRRRALRDG